MGIKKVSASECQLMTCAFFVRPWAYSAEAKRKVAPLAPHIAVSLWLNRRPGLKDTRLRRQLIRNENGVKGASVVRTISHVPAQRREELCAGDITNASPVVSSHCRYVL